MDKIKEVMLGHLAQDIDIVIMTPLKSTYSELKNRLDVVQSYEKVFFENCIFNIEGQKRGLIVLSPQGIAAKDVIELFENTKVLFFGLAGSLHQELEIGTFVEVEIAIYNDEDVRLKTTHNFKTVKCGYSPCMLGEIADEHCKRARTQGCDVVDMEVAACAKTAMKKGDDFIALLLISDIPGVINFWEVPEEIKTNFANERKNAISIIINSLI